MSIDGTGLGITNVAVGSHRYRVTFKGPGGHSFGAFGIANPIHALGRAIAQIAELQVPACTEDDLQRRPHRRRHVGELDSVRGVDGSRHAIVGPGVARRARSPLQTASTRAAPRRTPAGASPAGHGDKELVGDRPAGRTPDESPIVQTALSVSNALGQPERLGEGSTDSNIR